MVRISKEYSTYLRDAYYFFKSIEFEYVTKDTFKIIGYKIVNYVYPEECYNQIEIDEKFEMMLTQDKFNLLFQKANEADEQQVYNYINNTIMPYPNRLLMLLVINHE